MIIFISYFFMQLVVSIEQINLQYQHLFIATRTLMECVTCCHLDDGVISTANAVTHCASSLWFKAIELCFLLNR